MFEFFLNKLLSRLHPNVDQSVRDSPTAGTKNVVLKKLDSIKKRFDDTDALELN